MPQTRGELFREFGRYQLGWGLRREPTGELLRMLLPEQQTVGLKLDELDAANRDRVMARLAELVEPLLGQLAFAMLSDQTQGTEANYKWALNAITETAPYSFEYLDPTEGDFLIGQVVRKKGKLLKLAQRGGLLNLIEYPKKPTQNRLRFSHQLLQEYFAATYLARPDATPADWKEAAHRYEFDEVFPFLIDLVDDPTYLVKEVLWPVDFELARRCVASLPQEKLNSELRRWLINGAVARLEGNFEPDWIEAIYVLVQLKAIKELQEISLAHSVDDVRRKAAEALAKLGVKEVIPQLIEQLHTSKKEHKTQALSNLEELGAREAIPQLIKLLKDNNIDIRNEIIMVDPKVKTHF